MTSWSSRQAPRFTPGQASQLARELYGVTATADALPSYQDQNFHLRCTPSGRQLVLKIANPVETEEGLDFQNRAMEHVADRCPLGLPRLRTTLSGERFVRVTEPGGSTHLVRLLTFVPGKTLATVEVRPPELLRDLGRAVADVDRALASYSHPAAIHPSFWDPSNAGRLRDYVRYIEPATRRRLAERFHERFASRVEPRLAGLRRGLIHNDASHHNFLVVENGNGGHHVNGLIDFGDVAHAPTVCDPAVTAAYLILGTADPLATAARILGGYHERLPLTDDEIGVAYDLICARLITSATSSAYRHGLDPANEYLVINQRPAWTALEQLFAAGPREARRVFRGACRPRSERRAGVPVPLGTG